MVVAFFGQRGGGVFPASPDASPAATERFELTYSGLSTLVTYAEDYIQSSGPGSVTLDVTGAASSL